EERDESRTPIVAGTDRSGPPSPAVGAVIPASPVIWSPTPRIRADPAPAVVIRVDPATCSIRGPARFHTRDPNVTIRSVVHPAAVRIERFRTINIRAHITRTDRAFDIAVALVAPAVELIVRNVVANLNLRIRIGAAGNHCPPRPQ